jgi:hypothetical protein
MLKQASLQMVSAPHSWTNSQTLVSCCDTLFTTTDVRCLQTAVDLQCGPLAEHTVGHTARTSRENSLLENGGDMRMLVDQHGVCMIKHTIKHSVHNHTSVQSCIDYVRGDSTKARCV